MTGDPDETRKGLAAIKSKAVTVTTLTRVTKPNMVMRSLRVPADLWEKARAKADERGENISDVLRDALERYVKRK